MRINPNDFLTIDDLKLSSINLALLTEIVILNKKVEVLTEIVIANKLIDPLGFDVVTASVSNKPEYEEIEYQIKQCAKAIMTAKDDPAARLRAMFKAKTEGRI